MVSMAWYTKESILRETLCKMIYLFRIVFYICLYFCFQGKALERFDLIVVFRFPIAVKTPNNTTNGQIELLMEEAKTMLRIESYHDHIVNLQGIIFIWDHDKQKFAEVIQIVIIKWFSVINHMIDFYI